MKYLISFKISVRTIFHDHQGGIFDTLSEILRYALKALSLGHRNIKLSTRREVKIASFHYLGAGTADKCQIVKEWHLVEVIWDLMKSIFCRIKVKFVLDWKINYVYSNRNYLRKIRVKIP